MTTTCPTRSTWTHTGQTLPTSRAMPSNTRADATPIVGMRTAFSQNSSTTIPLGSPSDFLLRLSLRLRSGSMRGNLLQQKPLWNGARGKIVDCSQASVSLFTSCITYNLFMRPGLTLCIYLPATLPKTDKKGKNVVMDTQWAAKSQVILLRFIASDLRVGTQNSTPLCPFHRSKAQRRQILSELSMQPTSLRMLCSRRRSTCLHLQ